MNVLKIFLNSIVCLFCLTTVYSINYSICEVKFQEPFFKILDQNGTILYLVDSDGDTFIQGEKSLNAQFSKNHFQNSNYGFSKEFSKFNIINQKMNSEITNPNNSIVIKNSSSNIVSTLSDSGDIQTKGVVVYEDGFNSEVACQSDDYYCKNSQTSEYRDYYCQINGNLNGSCEYKSSNVSYCGDSGICSDGNCYTWKTTQWSACSGTSTFGTWGACSKNCDGGIKTRSCSTSDGTKTRSVWCEDKNGNTINDTFCDISLKPTSSEACSSSCASSTESCNVNACGSYTRHAWSSQTCASSYTMIGCRDGGAGNCHGAYPSGNTCVAYECHPNYGNPGSYITCQQQP